MRKTIFFILGCAAAAVAVFSMFKLLTFKDYGETITEANSQESGSSIEEASPQAGKEAGEGINQEKD